MKAEHVPHIQEASGILWAAHLRYTSRSSMDKTAAQSTTDPKRTVKKLVRSCEEEQKVRKGNCCPVTGFVHSYRTAEVWGR